jgi:hypothetical protein
MANETLTLTNTDWVRIEQQNADGVATAAANFRGAQTLFLVDGENGCIVQGVDKDGVATFGRFKGVQSIDELVVKAKLSDPTKPAGFSSTATQQPTGK